MLFFCINLGGELTHFHCFILAQDINSKEYYAVKRESLDIDNPRLHHERMIYDTLAGGRM